MNLSHISLNLMASNPLACFSRCFSLLFCGDIGRPAGPYERCLFSLRRSYLPQFPETTCLRKEVRQKTHAGGRYPSQRGSCAEGFAEGAHASVQQRESANHHYEDRESAGFRRSSHEQLTVLVVCWLLEGHNNSTPKPGGRARHVFSWRTKL